MRTLALLLTLTVALSALPGAAAESGSLQGDELRAARAAMAGDLSLLTLRGVEYGDLRITVEASSVTGTIVETWHPYAARATGNSVATLATDAQETAVELGAVELVLQPQWDAFFDLNTFTTGDAAALEIEAGPITASSLYPAAYRPTDEGGSGSRVHQGGSGAHRVDSPPRGPSSIDFEGPQLWARAEAAGMEIQLAGDLILEMDGLDLVAPEGSINTTWREEPVRNGAPAAADGVAGYDVFRFARVQLTDAVLTIQSVRLPGQLDWVWTHGHVMPTDAAQLTAAQGTIRVDLEELHGDGGNVALPPGVSLAIQPGEEHLAVSPAEEGIFVQDAVISEPRSPLGWLALLAVVPLAGGAFAWRRRVPAMEAVEEAMEAQRFRQAARLAAARLRKHPTDESSLVARAVSLSRLGDHSAVVRTLESRLSSSAPADGVLPFVLGVAHLNLRRGERALIWFERAVELTPSLDADVRAYLGDAGPEAEGYT